MSGRVPRERSLVDLDPRGGTVDPTGFAAAAASEGAIGRQLDGIGDMFYRDAAKIQQQKGRDEGLADPIKRGALEYEQFTKNVDGSVSRQVVRDPNGKIEPPQTAPYSLRFYDQTFHQSQLDRYVNTVQNDARAKAAELATQFKTQPKEFAAAWSAYRDAQIKNLAVPFSGPAAVTLEDVGQQHFRSIVSARGEQDFKFAVEAHTAGLERTNRDVINGLMQGRSIADPEMQRMVRLHSQLLKTGSGEGLRYYSPDAAKEQQRKFMGQIAIAQIMADVGKRQATGNIEIPATPGTPATTRPKTDEENAADVLNRLGEAGGRDWQPDKAPLGYTPAKRKTAIGETPETAAVPGTPGMPAKPGNEKAYLAGRDNIAAFIKGDATVAIPVEQKDGTWKIEHKKASEFLSVEERTELANKASMLMEYTEKTREKFYEVWRKASTIEMFRRKLNDAITSSRTGQFDEKGAEDAMKSMAESGNPDMALSYWSFTRSLKDHQRTELNREASDIATRHESQDLIQRIYNSGFKDTLFASLLPGQIERLTAPGTSPAALNHILKYDMARIEAYNRGLQLTAGEKSVQERMASHGRTQQAIIDKGGTYSHANLEQTEQHGNAIAKAISRVLPNFSYGQDEKADLNVIDKYTKTTGVIDERFRDYFAAAIGGGDPKALQRAVALARYMENMPNVGTAKLHQVLGNNLYDAFQRGRSTLRFGGDVESTHTAMKQLANGEKPYAYNEVQAKDFMAEAQKEVKHLVSGAREIDVGFFRVGEHVAPMPGKMMDDVNNEIRQSMGKFDNPADAAAAAVTRVKQRWAQSNLTYDPGGSSHRQPAYRPTATEPFPRSGILPSSRVWWSESAPEKFYGKEIRDEAPSIVKAQLLAQFTPTAHIKAASDLKLGENVFLDEKFREGPDGKKYWQLMVTMRGGGVDRLPAKSGTSASGYVEVSFDDAVGMRRMKDQRDAQRDASLTAERSFLTHKLAGANIPSSFVNPILKAIESDDYKPDKALNVFKVPKGFEPNVLDAVETYRRNYKRITAPDWKSPVSGWSLDGRD